jgi:precorrin-3B methylase
VAVGVTALVTVVAAVGAPLTQDTTMVTLLAVVAKTTRAVVAGPRATLLAWKPC